MVLDGSELRRMKRNSSSIYSRCTGYPSSLSASCDITGLAEPELLDKTHLVAFLSLGN